MSDTVFDASPAPLRSNLADAIPHLLVVAAGTVVAIRADETLEIWQAERCQPVPGAPRYVLGIANWRGTPLPIVDLTVALGLAEPSRRADALNGLRIVVVSVAQLLVGLLVDSTSGVLDIDAASCRDPNVVMAGRIGEFSLGEFDAPQGIGALIDVASLLEALRVRS